MNNTEILNALASLINTTASNKGIDISLAYQNFYNYSKLNCRPATLSFYDKSFKVLKRSLTTLGIFYTSEVTKASYRQ